MRRLTREWSFASDPAREREIPFPVLTHKDREELIDVYSKNKVITSKYTILNFVPKNIWEQLHKAANSYFLLISFIMFIGNYTPLFHGFIRFYSTFLALLIMMTASAVIAALDDKRRHEADVHTNNQIAHRVHLVDGKCSSEDVRWADVTVGDILIIEGDGTFPADLLPLASSSQTGGCYVDTANLDGESNLKLKESVKCTQHQLRYATTDQPLLDQAVANLTSLRGQVVAEPPQKSIHSFKGRIEMDQRQEPLDAKHLLLRGTVLKNTSWILGLVVYTGPETRMVMNSRAAKAKYPNIEKVINRSMLVVVGAQCVMALISDILYLVTKRRFHGLWYLFPSGQFQSILLPEFIGYWLTFFVLYSNLMPISLYFTMEVCNAAQAYFIKNDLKMYDEAQDTPANARTTNLCHELGQVAYVFSDKTGTLTQNVMELKQLSIAGVIYGQTGEESGFQGKAALFQARFDPQKAAAIDAVMEVLSVSHTVVSSKDRSGKLKYEAESPDEGALVEAVAQLGWSFTGRSNEGLTVEVTSNAKIGSRTYELLALNAFTSARKRQSVLVRRPSGEVLLLVKGADDVMQKLATDPQMFPEEHLRSFAKQGLRTLVMGRRFIPEHELQQWLADYSRAQTSMEDREGALARAADKIERSLEILGITGIEDKLQVGVEDAIVKIRQAGIKLWVLTGDKLETAKNIGFSTRVLSSSMEILTLDVADRKAFKDDIETLRMNALQATNNGVTVALIVTGHALEEIMRREKSSENSSERSLSPQNLLSKGRYQDLFLEVAVVCSVVIACRVSPLQKSEMVTLVRKGISPSPVTLAIGDGANDVPMLQEAQVGVGISGREGRQAVNSADFAISQFRYLARLMLVHGRWNYRRACKFVIYSFWKNAVLVLLMFYYTFVSGYAGQSLFEDMVRASYNFVLAAPIITTGVFDQDVTEEQAMADPRLYVSGREGLDLNATKLIEMLLSAAVHSCVIGFVMLMVYHDMSILHAGDYYTFGTTVFSVLLVSMNYRAAFVTRTWNWVTLAGQACSFFLYLLFLLLYCNVEWMTQHFQPWMYKVPNTMATSPHLWICVITLPALAMVIDVFKAHLLSEFYPDRAEVVLEQWKLKAESECKDEEDHSHQNILRSQTTTSRMSGYDFAHPGGEPRQVRDFVNPHPTAGDLSLIDAERSHVSETSRSMTAHQQLEESHSSEEDSQGCETVGPSNYPDSSSFAQQKIPHIQVEWNALKVMFAATVVGIILLLLSLLANQIGESAVEISIHYNSTVPVVPVVAVQLATVLHAPCEGKTCRLEVVIPEDMPAPIKLMYNLNPFYQNYPNYILSGSRKGAWPQLTGEFLQGGDLEKQCPVEATRLAPSGAILDPCGLQACSFFNDVFRLKKADGQDLVINQDHIASPDDLERMKNPPDYPNTLPGVVVDWLYKRYPEVISVTEGVRNQRFVDWMRPAALPSLLKGLGQLDEPLSKGQTVLVEIDLRFPASNMDVQKKLVMISPSGLGGDSQVLSSFLFYAGVACFIIAVIVFCCEKLCKRPLGHPRFQRMRIACEDESRESSSSDSDRTV